MRTLYESFIGDSLVTLLTVYYSQGFKVRYLIPSRFKKVFPGLSVTKTEVPDILEVVVVS